MEPARIQSAGLSELIQHSHSMLKHAEAGDWETVINDDAVRREMINAFFSQPSNVAGEPEIGAAIQELLKLNDRLEKLTVDARNSAKHGIDTVNKGRKAVNAYTENAG